MAELQLRIRAQALQAAGTADMRCIRYKRLATFCESEADKWGITVEMLKNICSEKTAQKSQTFVEAKRKARPDKRGKGSYWKKFEGKAEGRRVGQVVS